MEHICGLKCVKCGREHDVRETMYTCLSCGLEGTLDVVYDMDVVAKRFLRRIKKQTEVCTPDSIWRYLDLLPVQDDRYLPHLQVGWTPLYLCDAFAKRYSQEQHVTLPVNLYIKDDGRNPTASLKDRASAIAVVKATLVVLYFMHVRYGSRLVWLIVASALFWLVILFALTLPWASHCAPCAANRVCPTSAPSFAGVILTRHGRNSTRGPDKSRRIT